MIQARFRKSFPAAPHAAPFSLEIELEAGPGITTLFGPGGAGKTLTLEAIAGFASPEEGRILLDDQILFDAASGVNLPPRRRHCGYVLAGYALFPHLSLRQNLAFAAETKPRLERHRKVNEMLERFGLAEAAGLRPHEVSEDHKQRCALARALIGAPRLLLLDEPARPFDAALLRQARSELEIPILLATRRLEDCFELGQQMLLLNQGRLLASGPPRQLAERPASLEAARLLGLFNLLEAEIVELDPQHNTSRLRLWGHDLSGPYFPGKLRGDRVWVCTHPQQLGVAARAGRPGPNQVPAQLIAVIETPLRVRLEFAGGLAVELPRPDFERQKDNKEWCVEFPTAALRVL